MVAVLLLAATASLSAEPDFRQHQAVQESLSRVHPRFRAAWLKERGLDDSHYGTFRTPGTDSGLRCIGRWSYGPSYDVDGRVTPTETLVVLVRRSGVSLVRIDRSSQPHVELVSEIDCRSLAYQAVLRESLLFVATRAGVAVYDISVASAPALLAEVAVPVNVLDASDTLLCIAGPDAFLTYGSAAAPHRLGHCLAPGADIG
jgi:hypothetical protein